MDDPLARQVAIEAAHPYCVDEFEAHTRWHAWKTPFVICSLEIAKEQADILAAAGKNVHTWHNGDMVYHSYADGRKGEGWPK